MGDRYNVGFKASEFDTPIWLYSHWGGVDRYDMVSDAIESARPRWHDASYATRIAISALIGPHWAEPTGYGINAGETPSTMGDHNDAIIVIWDQQLVQLVDDRDPSIVRYTMTFTKFLNRLDRGKAIAWILAT